MFGPNESPPTMMAPAGSIATWYAVSVRPSSSRMVAQDGTTWHGVSWAASKENAATVAAAYIWIAGRRLILTSFAVIRVLVFTSIRRMARGKGGSGRS
jgi:hypothetical protein